MTVKLLSHTPDPETLTACAYRVCYSDAPIGSLLDGQTDPAALVRKLLALGHESPLEHVSFTFSVEGVSRALLAQLTRHRHASYSVRSQRYVDAERFGTVMPESVRDNPAAAEVFRRAVRDAQTAYGELQSLGILKEDARFVLPNAADTQLLVTLNARSLRNFFRLRCCNRAQWEIHALADEFLRLARSAAPSLFEDAGPGCCAGDCPEGALSCGRMAETRERYAPCR